jgi:hypothetical protein
MRARNEGQEGVGECAERSAGCTREAGAMLRAASGVASASRAMMVSSRRIFCLPSFALERERIKC